MTDKQKQDLFESERGTRTITTGRTATDIAAGKIPEGVVPIADVEDISMKDTTAGTVQLDPTRQATATTIDKQEAEQLSLIHI